MIKKRIFTVLIALITFINAFLGYMPITVYAADKVNTGDVTPDLNKFVINRSATYYYMPYYIPDMIIGDDGNLYAGTMNGKLYSIENYQKYETASVSPDGKWTIPFPTLKFSKFCGNNFILSDDRTKIYSLYLDTYSPYINERATSSSPIIGVLIYDLGGNLVYITEDDINNGFSKQFKGPDNNLITWTYDTSSSEISLYGNSIVVPGQILDFHYDYIRRSSAYENYLYIETSTGITKITFNSVPVSTDYPGYHGLGSGRNCIGATAEAGQNPVNTGVLCYDNNNSVYDLTNNVILSDTNNLLTIGNSSIDYNLDLIFPGETNENRSNAGSLTHICKWSDLNIDFTEEDLVNDQPKDFICPFSGKVYTIKPSEYDKGTLNPIYTKISDADCTHPEIWGVISPLSHTTLFSRENGYALGHTYEQEGGVNKKYNEIPSTCASAGSYDLHCTVCDEYISNSVPKLAHDFSGTETRVVPPTCTKQGYTSKKCANCDTTQYEYYINELHYSESSYAATNARSNLTAALGHDWELVSNTATCRQDGIAHYECSRCDEEKDEPSSKSDNHDFEIITTSATCTEDGYSKVRCRLCGEEYIDSYQEALGHDYHSSITTPASCDHTGIETFTCSRCGDSYTEVIQKTDHHYTETTLTSPTCTEKGRKKLTCDNCHDEKFEDIPALGHSWTVTHTLEPTTTSEGSYHYYCNTCGTEFDKTISKLFPITVQAGQNTILINNMDTGYIFFTGPNSQKTEGQTIDLQTENSDQYGNRQIRLSVEESIPVKAAGQTFYYGTPTTTHKGINILDDIITIDGGIAKEWIWSSSCRSLTQEKKRNNPNIISTAHYHPEGIRTRLGSATLDMSYGINGTGYILALSDDGTLYTTNRAVHGNCDTRGGYVADFSRAFTRESNEVPFLEVSSMEKNAAALCTTGQICIINTDFIKENNDLTDEMFNKFGYEWYFDENRPVFYYTDPSVTFLQASAGALKTYGIDSNDYIREIYSDGTFSDPINSVKYKQISSGYDHYLAIDENGNLWGWGKNTWGQIGDGQKGNEINEPIQITNGTYFMDISAGKELSAAVDSDYNVYTWGLNNVQQTGLMKDALNDVHEPVLLYNVRHIHTYQSRNSIKEDLTVSCGQSSKITLKCSECNEEIVITTEPKEHEYIKPLYNFIHWYGFKKALTNEPILKYTENGTTYEYTANKPDLYTILVKQGSSHYLYAFANNSCSDPFNSPQITVFHLKAGTINEDLDVSSNGHYIYIPNSSNVQHNGTNISEKHFFDSIYAFVRNIDTITDSNAVINTDEVIEVPSTETSVDTYVYKTLYDRAYEKFDFNQPCEGTHIERRICKHCYHAIEEEVESHHEFSLTGDRTSTPGYITYTCKKCGYVKSEPITYSLKFRLPSGYPAYWAEPEKLSVALKYDEEYTLPEECENSGEFYINFGPYSLTEDGNTHIAKIKQIIDHYSINGTVYHPGDTVKELTTTSDMYLFVDVYYKWEYEGDASDLLANYLYYKNSRYAGSPLIIPSVRTGVSNQSYWGASYNSGWIVCIDAWDGMTFNHKDYYSNTCIVKPGLIIDAYNKNLSCTTQNDAFATDMTIAAYTTEFATVGNSDYAGVIYSSFEEAGCDPAQFTELNNVYIYRNTTRYGDRPYQLAQAPVVYRSQVQTIDNKPYYIYIISDCWDYLNKEDNDIVLSGTNTSLFISEDDPLNITTRYKLHYTDPTGTCDPTFNEDLIYTTGKISNVRRGYLSLDKTKVLSSWTTDREGKNTVYSQKGLRGTIDLYPLWEDVESAALNINPPEFKNITDIRKGDVYSPDDIVLIGETSDTLLSLLGHNSTSTDVVLNTDNDNLSKAFDRHISGATHLPAVSKPVNKIYFIRGDINEIRTSDFNDSVKERIGNNIIYHTGHNAYINYGGSPVYGEIVGSENGIKLLSGGKLYTSSYIYTAYTTLDIVKESVLTDDYVYLTTSGPKNITYNGTDFVTENGNTLQLSTRVYKKNDVYMVNNNIPDFIIETDTSAYSNLDIDVIIIDDTHSYYSSEGDVLTKQNYTKEQIERLYDSYVILHYNGFNDFSDFISVYILYALENDCIANDILNATGFYILNFPIDKEVKKHRFYVEKYTVSDIDKNVEKRVITLEPSIIELETYAPKAYEYQPMSVKAEALKTPDNSEWHLKYEADHFAVPFYANFLAPKKTNYPYYDNTGTYVSLITPILEYKDVSQKITFHIDSWDAYNDVSSIPNIYLYNKNGKNISLNNKFGVTIKKSDPMWLPLNGEHIEEIFAAQGSNYEVNDQTYESYAVLTKEGHIWANGGDNLSAYGAYHIEQTFTEFSGRYYEYQHNGGYQDFIRLGPPNVKFKKVFFRYGSIMAIDENGNLWAQSTISAISSSGFRQVSKGVKFADFAKYNYYYTSSGMYLLDEDGNVWGYYDQGLSSSTNSGLDYLAYFQGSEYAGARSLNSNETSSSYGFPVVLTKISDGIRFTQLAQTATGGHPCLQAIDENGDLWIAGYPYNTIGYMQDSVYAFQNSDTGRTMDRTYFIEKFTKLDDIYDTYKGIKWKNICIKSGNGYNQSPTSWDAYTAYIDDNNNLWRALSGSVGYVITEQNVLDYNGQYLLTTDGQIYDTAGYNSLKGINGPSNSPLFDGKKFKKMGNIQQYYLLTEDNKYLIPNTSSTLYHYFGNVYETQTAENYKGYDVEDMFFNGYSRVNKMPYSDRVIDSSVKKDFYQKEGETLGYGQGFDVTIDLDYLSELDNIQFENGDSVKIDSKNNTRMNIIKDVRLYTYGLVDEFLTSENKTEDKIKSATSITMNTLNIPSATKDLNGASLYLRSLYTLDPENYYSDRITLEVEALKELKAEYTGEPVVVGRDANPEDIKLTLIYEDNHEIEITYADLTNKPDTLPITIIGDNPFNLSFHDKNTTVNIPGVFGIVSATATYPESVWKGAQFDTSKISLTLTYSDNSTATGIVTDNHFTDRTVTTIGNNTFTFDYSDGTYSIRNVPLTVHGYYYDRIEAEYAGDPIKVNNNYDKADVNATVYYTANSFNRTSDTLEVNEWSSEYFNNRTRLNTESLFTESSDDLKIRKKGSNPFLVKLLADTSLTDTISVEGLSYISGITAKYTGPEILVGNKYDKKDVVVTAIYEGENNKIIPMSEWTESDLLVTKVGDNDYIATYNGMTAPYKVPGIEESKPDPKDPNPDPKDPDPKKDKPDDPTTPKDPPGEPDMTITTTIPGPTPTDVTPDTGDKYPLEFMITLGTISFFMIFILITDLIRRKKGHKNEKS